MFYNVIAWQAFGGPSITQKNINYLIQHRTLIPQLAHYKTSSSSTFLRSRQLNETHKKKFKVKLN